jgi:hypothetical protein
VSGVSIRRVEPEWLDTLPRDDARAMRSRRDLVLVNRLMDNAAIVAGELRAGLPPRAVRIAEIGAGDGRFALRVACKLAPQEGQMTLLDRLDAPTTDVLGGLADEGWQANTVIADAFQWLADPATPRYDAIFANLFLHHFQPAELTRLLALAAARTRLFVACEPRRSDFALAGSRMLGLIGCNDVTQHDAVVSVRAGFQGSELSSLWPRGGGWHLEEHPRGLFSHSFVAERP